jgi:hypothetical protein
MAGGGGKGGGGSSASSSVDVTLDGGTTVDIVGLDDINVESSTKLEGGDPIKTETKVEGGDPIKTEASSSIELKPVEADLDLDTDTVLEVKPLETDSSITVDLKPAVVDLCLTANIGKVPDVCVRQPYEHHVGMTLFGMEIWGFTFSGEQRTTVEGLDRTPKVAGRTGPGAWPPRATEAQAYESPPAAARPTRQAGGLRIRLGD